MDNAVYEISKIDNNRYCRSNGQFTKHLRKNNLTYQQYYETYITGIARHCTCGKPLTFFQKNHSYAESCGAPMCVGKNVSKTKQNWTNEQKKQDSANKKKAAALKTPEQISKQVSNSKETFRKKYGVDWATKSIEHKTKSKQTKLSRYGNEYFNGNDKTSAAWQSKTDEEIEVIVNKRRKTCLDRFGVENALMKPEARINSAKSNSKGKDFTLPSGKMIGVRGYEDQVITKLLETYNETVLVIADKYVLYSLPIFEYVNVHQHRTKYYPDIFIPSENKIIECKSQWWWNGNGSTETKYQSRLTNNLRKKDAVLKAGYTYEVWLFSSKNKYEILKWQ